KRTNVVFILADDLGPWALGCLGNGEGRTPNIDRLAEGGMLFTSFFCSSPVCSPARASILTGTIPSVHGVHDWLRAGNIDRSKVRAPEGNPNYGSGEHEAIPFLEGFTSYTDVLADNGYRCALSGKWHLGDSLRPQCGFSEWFTLVGGGCAYFHPDTVRGGEVRFESGYVTDVITDSALGMLDGLCGGEAPFYLSVHYTSPHSPWDEANHKREHLDLYRDCGFLTVPDPEPHPWQINSAPRGKGEVRRELLRGYFAAITAMDENVGRIVRKLEDKGELDDTLIILTSDNGMNMGHHGVWGKGNGTFPQNMYDTSVKVPFIASHRGVIAPSVCDGLMCQCDIFPTLMEYLGIGGYEARQPLLGASFAGVLRGGAARPAAAGADGAPGTGPGPGPGEAERFVVVYDEYGPVRMIRGVRWKYVHRYPYGPNELYDMETDPGEESNLIGEAERAGLIESMKARLDAYFVGNADPRVDGTREPVTGFGQLRRCGVWSGGMKVYG
ncbi:MAG: sulfatase-like hydrolase/transferase, partial [Oscillospiraceae bacterium]|nr:sulfatase-like hydrolase/transferase [Oscillospiraceae bacterium]